MSLDWVIHVLVQNNDNFKKKDYVFIYSNNC